MPEKKDSPDAVGHPRPCRCASVRTSYAKCFMLESLKTGWMTLGPVDSTGATCKGINTKFQGSQEHPFSQFILSHSSRSAQPQEAPWTQILHRDSYNWLSENMWTVTHHFAIESTLILLTSSNPHMLLFTCCLCWTCMSPAVPFYSCVMNSNLGNCEKRWAKSNW